jgi:hypothetical protein
MAHSYYEMLGVAPTAPLDEIKKAFRREIAKYHPDKVQHLGREFQEIAAVKAAELTQAYKTLCDEALRAEYDGDLAGGSRSGGRDPGSERWRAAEPEAPAAAPAARPAARSATANPDRQTGGAAFTTDRAASDLLSKAAVARFRQAIAAEFGQCDETPVPGFEIACAPPKGRLWSKVPPRILARAVAHVDAAAVTESWALAARMPRARDDQREVCIFLMGPSVAPAGELARAIAEERRRPVAGGKLFLVPLNTRSWSAHIPADAPAVVKSLVGRLKSA